MIESLDQVSGEFQMLLLVLTDGNRVGPEQENVGGHQHRIRIQTEVRSRPIRLVFELSHAIQLPGTGDRPEDPCQFGVLRYLALVVEE